MEEPEYQGAVGPEEYRELSPASRMTDLPRGDQPSAVRGRPMSPHPSALRGFRGGRTSWSNSYRRTGQEPAIRNQQSPPVRQRSIRKKRAANRVPKVEPAGFYRYMEEAKALAPAAIKREGMKLRHKRLMITAKCSMSGTAVIPLSDATDYLWPLSPYYWAEITEVTRGMRTMRFPTAEHYFGMHAAYQCGFSHADTARIQHVSSPAACRLMIQSCLSKAESKQVNQFECRGSGYHLILTVCRLKAEQDERVRNVLIGTGFQYLAYDCRHTYLGVGPTNVQGLRVMDVPAVALNANWVGLAWMQVREEIREKFGPKITLPEEVQRRIQEELDGGDELRARQLAEVRREERRLQQISLSTNGGDQKGSRGPEVDSQEGTSGGPSQTGPLQPIVKSGEQFGQPEKAAAKRATFWVGERQSPQEEVTYNIPITNVADLTPPGLERERASSRTSSMDQSDEGTPYLVINEEMGDEEEVPQDQDGDQDEADSGPKETAV
jgi:predicted NAD-dependent protein-ADP-ribosyltransferase YbiA (DUF1768 family)